ncbi:MAG: SCO family protein [candidate division WOR-3 bacterium]
MKRAVFVFLVLLSTYCTKSQKNERKIKGEMLTVLMHVGNEYRRLNVSGDKLREFPFGFTLMDEDGKEVKLRDFKGKVLVVGYIYTHCPDICPMITQNMKEIYKLLGNDAVFLSITIDPERDQPKVLKEYKEIHEIKATNWKFLTGNPATIDSLLKIVGIDKSKYEEGNTYFLSHTDRIHIIDKNGYIRGYFMGSSVVADSVAKFVRGIILPQT